MRLLLWHKRIADSCRRMNLLRKELKNANGICQQFYTEKRSTYFSYQGINFQSHVAITFKAFTTTKN